jgi:hypothetical protein
MAGVNDRHPSHGTSQNGLDAAILFQVIHQAQSIA